MKKVVWLRVYEGKKILRAENGSIENVNQLVKLTHNTLEWYNYLKNLRATPFCKVEVEKVLIPSEKITEKNVIEGSKTYIRKNVETTYETGEITDALKREVSVAFVGIKEKELTPDQKEIAELKAKVERLLSKESASKSEGKKPDETDDKSELDSLREAYEKKFGKPPHHMKREKKLKEELSK